LHQEGCRYISRSNVNFSLPLGQEIVVPESWNQA